MPKRRPKPASPDASDGAPPVADPSPVAVEEDAESPTPIKEPTEALVKAPIARSSSAEAAPYFEYLRGSGSSAPPSGFQSFPYPRPAPNSYAALFAGARAMAAAPSEEVNQAAPPVIFVPVSVPVVSVQLSTVALVAAASTKKRRRPKQRKQSSANREFLDSDSEFEYRSNVPVVAASERVARNATKLGSFDDVEAAARSSVMSHIPSAKRRKRRSGNRYVWNYFFKCSYAKMRDERLLDNPDYKDVQFAFKDIARELGERWRSMSAEGRAQWKTKADADREGT